MTLSLPATTGWEAPRRGRPARAPCAQTRSRTTLLLATGAIWTLSFWVWTVAAMAKHFPHQVEIALRGLTADVLGGLLCGVIFLVLRALEPRPLGVRFPVALVLAVAGTGLYLAYLHAIYFVVLPMAPPPRHWLLNHLDTAIAILWTFLAWVGVYFSLGFGTALREAEAMAVDSQNRMLRYQLDPHFLFNIHSALATLIHDHRNAEAERMVMSLSSFLRRSLERDPGDRVPLTEELLAMREYMGVEAVRFGDRLRFVETVDASVHDALAPSFILQPLLENAIKHGLGKHGLGANASPITVELGAAREGRDLKLWVQDDGAGGASAGGGDGRAALGVGLDNVRNRLRSFYGAGASLSIEQCSPRGFRATVTLPLGFA
jgi:two-component system LytT family sensor kinase